jgi:outer membrane protein assembly factor BamB
MTRLTRTLTAAVLAAAAGTAVAADWPQWMGPNRDAVWAETGIIDAFPAGGPKVLWKAPVGGGYAGPAVAGGKVYVADKVLKPGAAEPKNPFDTKIVTPTVERVLCLDAKTGKELWKHEYDCPYQVSYQAGPRCTPTVSGGKAYTLGTMGNLFCLDAETGKVVWSKDFKTDYQAKTPMWGFAGHPLVYKNLLICLVGGEGSVAVAFDKDTGKEAWKALSAPEPGYSPPTLIEAGGKPQLVVWHSKSINGLNPETGEKYWSVPLATYAGMSIMAPRQEGDYLFASGMAGAAAVLKLDREKPAVTVVWKEETAPGPGGKPKPRGLYPVNMTPFVENGVVYGVDQPGMLRAIELTTGKKLWYTFEPVIGKAEDEEFKGAGSGTAFIVKNGDRYFLFAETGDLIIAKLTPQGYEEISRAKLLDRTGSVFNRPIVWSHPAFADKCVFARNDKELVCVSLAKE